MSLASLVVACGARAESVRHEVRCDVRLPSASERLKGARAVQRYDELERRARASVRRMSARDDGSRPVDAKALAAGQRSRREEGLLASRKATRAVMLESPETTAEFGSPIALAEFRLLEFRSVIGDHAVLAQKYARQCLRDEYGGLYFGGDRRGQFVALPLTTGSAAVRAQLARRSTMGLRFLRTPHVRYTAAELTAAKERISSELEHEPDFRSIAPSMSDNHVALEIEPFTEARAAQLRERYGDILEVSPGTLAAVLVGSG